MTLAIVKVFPDPVTPFSKVVDDDGHSLPRGVRVAVCDKTFQIYRKAPYAEHFERVEPLEPIPLTDAEPFDCSRPMICDGFTPVTRFRMALLASG